jgi:hypothetical protein
MLAITEVSFIELSHHTHGLQVRRREYVRTEHKCVSKLMVLNWFELKLLIYLSASTNYYILSIRQGS